VRGESFPLLRVEGLSKVYEIPGGRLYAVDGVTFDIWPGEAVALVGESGSGKSTIGRCVTHLDAVTAGRIYFKGHEITRMGEAAFRRLRRNVQIVFQDPKLSLNPRLTVRQTLKEPLLLHRVAPPHRVEERLRDLLAMVSLDLDVLDRRPRELSGGQLQRVAIARAISTHPELVILDEPTASVDMSLRVQIVELLARLKRELGMAYLFITHDLSTARALCSRTLVLYLGRLLEAGTTNEVFKSPKHPYTRALVSSIPIPDPTARKARLILPGETPSPTLRGTGCVLAERCPYRMETCLSGEIPTFAIGGHDQHGVACLLYHDGETRSPWEVSTGIPGPAVVS
jgi:oligopeptide/dipeptide ABC transporter ATP-binding protein